MFPSNGTHSIRQSFLHSVLLLFVCLLLQGCPSDYMKECGKDGVPVPPKWGDPSWVNKGSMPKDKVFDAPPGKYSDTQVWVSVSNQPKGICYALPRIKKGGTIELLGMICQGENGNACFWDNKEPGTEKLITPAPGLDPADMADGSNLIEKCVECHRGDNAFAITPGTPLQQNYPGQSVSPSSQNGRPTSVQNPPYTPISTTPPRPGWTNDPISPVGVAPKPGDVKLADSGAGCEFCHSIPRLTPGYCALAQKMVSNGLMPPPKSVVAGDKDIQDDIKAIKNACNELKPGSWP
jgi:hypothetical protein